METKNNYKGLFLNVVNVFFLITLITFSLSPLIPNKIKGLPVVFLVLTAVLTLFIKETKLKEKINIKYTLLFSSLFILYILSLVYTENLKYGFRKLETTASLFLIPFSFAMIFKYIKISSKQIGLVKYAYILSSVIYAFSVLLYLNYLGFEYCLNNMSPCLSYLDGMFFLSEHPIYISMFIGLGIIFIINNFGHQNLFFKILLLIGLAINLYVLIFLTRKGVIIALAISFFAFFFKIKKLRRLNYIVIIVLLGLLFIFLFNFKDALVNRFSELGASITYEKIDENNSTSIRFAIYKCASLIIKENIYLGYGIGDVTDVLVSCYKKKAVILVENRYNSHNQYFGILLSVGIFGLIIFIMQLFVYLKSAFSNNDLLYLQILLFFMFLFLTENILDRQSGVILFSFLANYFYFVNYPKKII